ncbi:MAG TPA: nuclear transport factor 2 family protein [Geminicoccus sp.]|uniref:nuclear transport factor 2 family protein n=1 Tax=Geminicoccus sp. TaxID=2024832 RepID=UPI002C0B7547|nr:nuclear transport factor 2 family protein [Geminicoccus sp.]HWL68714.1 nuclear transport factor 2 family protein [Geminicoccus sp.]
MAQADGSVAECNKAIVRASFDAWRAGTGSPFELLAEDATWTITGNSAAAGSYAGKEAFLSEVIRPFNARMSVGLKPAIQGIYADGDTVIVLFDASGTARDGRTYANSYAWFLDMQSGLIVRARAFFDSIAFDDLWARVKPGP